MSTTWHSFWTGWRRATALWPVVVLLYLVDTALALVLTIPPAMELARVFGRSAMAPDLQGGLTLDLLIEATEGMEGAALPWPLYLLVPLLFVVVETFLRGGVLAALAGDASPFRWTDFFSNCARFFGRFLLLLLFLLPGLLVVLLVLLVALFALAALPVPEFVGSLAGLGLLAVLILLLLAALDYARVGLVLEPEHSAPRHLGRALGFLVRRLPQVVALGLAFALAAALFFAAYPALRLLSPLLDAFLPSLLLQQAAALAASWQRVAMLGGEMALYRALRAGGRGNETG